MKVETIVGKIRERYACGWKLSDTDAEKLILDFAAEYAKSRRFDSQKPNQADEPKIAEYRE
jgi:hypothetical protein